MTEPEEEMPDALTQEELEEHLLYLNEILDDYERFINNIGKNGISAKLMLNYRDDIQEMLAFLNNFEVDLTEYWKKVMRLDQVLRVRRSTVVREVGRKTFLMEQIKNEPPKNYWWWYIDRSEPKEKPGFWDFLKKPGW